MKTRSSGHVHAATSGVPISGGAADGEALRGQQQPSGWQKSSSEGDHSDRENEASPHEWSNAATDATRGGRANHTPPTTPLKRGRTPTTAGTNHSGPVERDAQGRRDTRK